MEMVSFYLVGNPEESHFHGSRPLFLDGVIGDTCGGLVVTMCRHWWLWMSKFLEYEAQDFPLLAIEKEGPQFGFSG